VEALRTYQDHPLVSAMDADLQLDDAADAVGSSELDGLLRRFGEVLADHVSEVRPSRRLTDSPVCLVLPEGGLPPYLERLMRLQQAELPSQKRILEVNPDHPLVASLRTLHERDAGSAEVSEWMEVLHDQALLAEGSPIDDPATFAQRLTALLTEAASHRVARAAG